MTTNDLFDRYAYAERTVYDDAKLGAALRCRRVAAALDAIVVAEAIGVTPAFLSMLENGKRRWSDERIDEYLTAIGETVADY